MKTSVASEKILTMRAAAGPVVVGAASLQQPMGNGVLGQHLQTETLSSVCSIPLKDAAGKPVSRSIGAPVTPADVLNSLRAAIIEKKPRRVKEGIQYGNTVITKDHIKTVAMVVTALSNIAANAPMVSRNAPEDCDLYRETLKASFPVSVHTISRHKQCEAPLQTFLSNLKGYRLRANEYQEIQYVEVGDDGKAKGEWAAVPASIAEAIQELIDTTPAQFNVLAKVGRSILAKGSSDPVLELPEMMPRKVENIRADLSIEEATAFLVSRLPERFGGEQPAGKGYTPAENNDRVANVEATVNLLKQTSEILKTMGIPFKVPEPATKVMSFSLSRNVQSQVQGMRNLWNSMRTTQTGCGDIEKSAVYITAIERPSDFRAKVKDVNEVYKHLDSMVASVELYEKLVQVYEDHNLAAIAGKTAADNLSAAFADAARRCTSSKLVKIVTGADSN